MRAEEQPRLPRTRRRIAVRFGTQGELSHHGLSVNLSSRGIGVASNTILPIGTTVRMELSLATGQLSHLSGVVVWAMRGALALNLPGSMGIRIDASDEAFLGLLARMTADTHDTDPELAPVAMRDTAPELAPVATPKHPTVDWWQDPDTEASTPGRGSRPVDAVSRVPRFFEQVPLRFGLNAALNLRGFTDNISRTGMAVSCPAALAPSETMLFALTLPDDRLCHGTGLVMWSRLGREASAPHSMGVRITRVEKNFKELLEVLARRH